MAMRIYPNYARGPGYAWIEVEAALPNDITFTISAPNRLNKPFLGVRGWQGSAYELKPLELSGTELGSRMLVGPPVVDHIWEDELIELRIPLASYSSRATWPDDVPPSGIAPPTNIVADSPQPPPIATVGDRGSKPVPPKPPNPPSSDDPIRPGRDSRIIPGPSPFRRLIIQTAWTIVGLLIGYGIGFLYMSPHSLIASTSASVDNIASDVADAQRLLPGAVEQAEQIYQIGLRLRASRAPANELGLQALHRAAELNFVPALLWFGKTADPTRDEWRGVRLSPDAGAALESYIKAERANSAEARQLKAALCRHMQADTTSSDSNREAVRNGCT
jgi:hypothetical protein